MINGLNIIDVPSVRILGEYSCGVYGADAYNSACTTSTGLDGGLLADTGYNILLPLALGLAIIIAGIILLIKRLKRRRATSH